LVPLLELRANWDSYGGQPLEPRVAEWAESLLAPLLVQGVAAPSFVPMSTGGLALEWHRRSVELVIHMPPGLQIDQTATAFFSDDVQGEEWERSLMDAQPYIEEALARLMDRAS
jgi:hypothetical protein